MPDYSSFAWFRSGKSKDAVEDLFYQFVKRPAELEETEYEEVFIDGTKIESMANRYTFVWKTGVEKNLAKLKEKQRKFSMSKRFLMRGKTNISTELFLLCLAFDLQKFFSKLQRGKRNSHLFPLKKE